MTPIGEDAAWALVRSAADLAADPSPYPKRVAHPTDPDVWIDLDGSGRWKSSAPTTRTARALLSLYLPLTTRADLVIAQMGQSLDGRIATASGDSRFVTGKEDIRRLHRLRALVDAVIVGANTASTDDPRLTVREVEGGNPVRVVLDPDGRLGPDLNVFTDAAAPTLLVQRATRDAPSLEDTASATPGSPSTERTADGRARGDRPNGATLEVIRLPTMGDGGFDPAVILAALRARGLKRVLVEGGGVTVSRFLAAGVLDRLHVCVAPLLIGSGRPAFTLPEIESLSSALRPRCRHVRLGEDLLFDLDFR